MDIVADIGVRGGGSTILLNLLVVVTTFSVPSAVVFVIVVIVVVLGVMLPIHAMTVAAIAAITVSLALFPPPTFGGSSSIEFASYRQNLDTPLSVLSLLRSGKGSVRAVARVG